MFGLAGGIVGLVLPVSVNLFAFYRLPGLDPGGTTLIALTSILVLAGAILLAVSLICYRLGFGALRRFDRWFLAATFLCTVGTIGLLMIVVSTAIALGSTPALDQCIQGAPTHALSCLKSVQPLTAYSAVAGFWMAWVGGLGIVVGLALGGIRYREVWILGASATYGLLLLVLIDPFVALLFPIGGWQYPLLTVPILALCAPILVYGGGRRARRSSGTRRPIGSPGTAAVAPLAGARMASASGSNSPKSDSSRASRID